MPDAVTDARGLPRRSRQGAADGARNCRRTARRAGSASHDWQRANASFFNAIQVERNVMFLILTLIIVVAAFNIISSLIMLVKDKGRAIAILRTMGATRGAIMRIFFISGASVGVVGTLFGFAVRPRLRPQHRDDPPVDPGADRHQSVRAGDLLPVAAAGEGRSGEVAVGHRHGAGLVVPGDHLSVVAGGAHRAGRGAAL